jgi:hypothetical protein
MKFTFKSVLNLSLLLMVITSCAKPISPGLTYRNMSRNAALVKNIKVIWSDYKPLGSSRIEFCGVHSQSYNLDRDSDFFGPVHIEWENAKGQKLSKDFTFTKEQLPSMKDRFKLGIENSSYIRLYFTQDDVYLYTSDTPNLKQIEADLYKKAGLTCQEYRDQEYIKKWGKDW